MAFNLMDWSAPADPDAMTATVGGTAANHPSGHIEALAQGFDRVRVLNAYYRFNVRFAGGDSAPQDFIVAYRFSNVVTSPLVHTDGAAGANRTTAIDNWKDVRQSRGWVYKRMSSTHSGGSIHPSAATINVRIPNVPALAKRIFAMPNTTDFTSNDYAHVVQDAAASADVNLFLLVEVFTIDGLIFAAEDIQIDVDVFQKVTLVRNQTDFNLEAADQEG